MFCNCTIAQYLSIIINYKSHNCKSNTKRFAIIQSVIFHPTCKNMKNTKWFLICIIGGILMIFYTIIGDILFFEIVSFIARENIEGDLLLPYHSISIIFLYVALYAGFLVIIGVIVIKRDYINLGKTFILIGDILGLIGLTIFITTGVIDIIIVNGLLLSTLYRLLILNAGIGFTGIILTSMALLKFEKIFKASRTSLVNNN